MGKAVRSGGDHSVAGSNKAFATVYKNNTAAVHVLIFVCCETFMKGRKGRRWNKTGFDGLVTVTL